jgi:hypothetical protein
MLFRIMLPALFGAGLSYLICVRYHQGDYPSLGLSIVVILQLHIFVLSGTIMLIRYALRRRYNIGWLSFIGGAILTNLVFLSLLEAGRL